MMGETSQGADTGAQNGGSSLDHGQGERSSVKLVATPDHDRLDGRGEAVSVSSRAYASAYA